MIGDGNGDGDEGHGDPHVGGGGVEATSSNMQRQIISRDTTRARRLRPERELAERTAVGDAYLKSLMRTQLAYACGLLAAVSTIIFGLPMLMWAVPGFRRLRVLGIPFGWIVLGGLVYPVLIAAAALFVRRAERNEAEFVVLVTGRDEPATAATSGRGRR